MKIFLSTNTSARFLIEQARSRLRRAGYEILSPWLERDPPLECDPDAPAKTPAALAREATADRAAVFDAEAMVYFPDGDSDEGAIQFGMALAQGKKIFLVGACGASYVYLPGVVSCADVYDFYKRLNAPVPRVGNDSRKPIAMPSKCLIFSPETFSQVVSVAAKAYRVTPADILGPSKKSMAVYARFAAILAAGKFLRQTNGHPPTQHTLGRAMNRDPSTILYAQKRAATMQRDFISFATALAIISREIEQLISMAQADARHEAENKSSSEGAIKMGTIPLCAVAASGDRVALPA
jgi:hypothetical protein